MKYIRTEEGIFEVKDNMKISFEKLFEDISEEVGSMYGTEEWVCYGKVLQQADTIEELCDEFVYYNPKTQIEKYRYEYYHNLSEKEYNLKELKKGVIIYGAIWTSKGLIYVAKMNDDGDLLLL